MVAEIPGSSRAYGTLTSSQVRALVDALRDIVTVLSEADPKDKAELYEELGLNLTYHTECRASPEGGQILVSEGRYRC